MMLLHVNLPVVFFVCYYLPLEKALRASNRHQSGQMPQENKDFYRAVY